MTDSATPTNPPGQPGAPTASAPVSAATQAPGGNVPGDSVKSAAEESVFDPPPRPGLLGVLDHFEIVKLLGRGGMGVVYLARDTISSASVAIKLLTGDAARDAQAVRRFLAEATSMARLSHRSILPVLSVSANPDKPYYAMRYVEPGPLSGLIRPGVALPAPMILGVAIAVAEALVEVHRRGMTHRDLKPANVLVDGEGHAYLADFGLVRNFVHDSLADGREPSCEGTAPYMSPMTAAGQPEDTRADIYSFGAMLYEMLTGSPPYTGPSTFAVLCQIKAGPPTPILSRNPAAPRRLAAIAEGAMARELRDRYAQMADVLADLKRAALEQTPLGPHRAGTAAGKGSRRLVVAGAVTVVTAATIALVREPIFAVGFLVLAVALGAAALAWHLKSPAPAVAKTPLAPPVQGPVLAPIPSSSTPPLAAATGDVLEQARAARIAELLKSARANDSRGNGRTALAVLDTLLVMDPHHAEALALRLKILAELDNGKIGDVWVNSLGMKFAYVPAGQFMMGSPENEKRRGFNETLHRVHISKPFMLGVHPVTQSQWERVMHGNPSKFKGDDLPVENISWNDAVAFCQNLGQTENRRYRLPTEAEWEYACRAGTTTAFNLGPAIVGDLANYDDGGHLQIRLEKGKDGLDIVHNDRTGFARKQTTPIGTFKPNAWGLFDMHGNVMQWCADAYGEYPAFEVTDPTGSPDIGPPAGWTRICRGGSWDSDVADCRSAHRTSNPLWYRSGDIGFRLAVDRY